MTDAVETLEREKVDDCCAQERQYNPKPDEIPDDCSQDDDDFACCSNCAASHAVQTNLLDKDNNSDKSLLKRFEQRIETVGTALLIVCGILALTGTGLHISGVESLATVAQLSSIIAAIIGLTLIATEVIEAIQDRRVDINILMVVAVIGASILGDFSEAGVVVFLFCLGEKIESYAIQRNRDSIANLMELTPLKVEVYQDGQLVEMRPEDVKLGSIAQIKPGSRLALDGTIVSGSSTLDESAITGESVPLQKGVGSQVYSGTMNVSDFIDVKVTATLENSTLARIVKLVEEAQEKRSPYERSINRFARYYTPIVLAAAIVVALLPPLIDLVAPTLGISGLALGGFDVWVYRALSMLVIACPCALVISTPVSVVCGLSRAAHAGIMVKGGAYLELGAKINAIAFDKTGTLTRGAALAKNELRDVLRPEASATMDELHNLGIQHTVMLSGDKHDIATTIGQEAHVKEAHGELLPQDKLDLLSRLKEQYGRVAMVGDGINDAPALTLADVGIAMGALGTDTAVEAADVALMEDSLEGLPRFIKLSKRVVQTIKVNISFALGVKAVVLVLAMLGIAGMWMAILADTGVLLLVLLNSMRLLRVRL